jgi:lysyl-tRNA synthetase class 2
VIRTRTGEVSLQVHEFKMLAKAITPLPRSKDEVVDGQVVRHARWPILRPVRQR